MTLKIAATGKLDETNQRTTIENIGSYSDIDLYVITDSLNYSPLKSVPQSKVYHLTPSWPSQIILGRYEPWEKIQFSNILREIQPDVLLSFGISHLLFMGERVGFSPNVFLKMGADLRKAQNWREIPKAKKLPFPVPGHQFVFHKMYKWQFKKMLNHVTEVWTAQINKKPLVKFGLDPDKFRPFDWVSVDTEKFNPDRKPINYISNNETTVIGSFRRIRHPSLCRDYKTFLTALGEIQNKIDFHLVLGGFYANNGAEVKEVIDRKIEHYGLEDNVTRLNLVPKSELPKYMAGIDVYVNFNHEGLPVGIGSSAKEAMASGAAPFCFDEPSPQYIIRDGENGIISPAGNVKETSLKIKEVCSSKEMQNSIQKSARETAKREFSKQNIAKEFVNICQGL